MEFERSQKCSVDQRNISIVLDVVELCLERFNTLSNNVQSAQAHQTHSPRAKKRKRKEVRNISSRAQCK